MAEQFKIIEYPLIIVFIICGALFLMSTNDLVSTFLSIELQSYGLYLLSTIHRNSEQATSGGLTYFLLGGLSSCFILLGVSLLYTNSGSTNLDGIYVITSLSDIASKIGDLSIIYNSYFINFAFTILSIGFLFKASAAPFHFWSPDVYDAIPTMVTTFVAIVAKISIFIFLLELVHYTSNALFYFEYSWTTSLLVSSLLSLTLGAVVGLAQFRIKRLFAYSTISHVGFILLGLSINSIESIQAFIFYLMQYTISNLNVFIILISVGFSLYYFINPTEEYKELDDKDNSPIQLISQIKGYFNINPYLALSLTITIFSFAGVPPMIGFFAKQMVLSAALDSGYIFITLVAILASVVSAVYYLNIVKQVFFDESIYTNKSDISLYGTICFSSTVENSIKPYGTRESFLQNILNTLNVLKTIRLYGITPNKSESYIASYFTTRVLKTLENISQRTPKVIDYTLDNITLASSLTVVISVLTSIIFLFIFMPLEWLTMANILALNLFNT